MNSSPLRRILQAITLVLIAVCAVSGFLGLRALIWRQEYQIASMIQSGVVLSLIIAGVIGLLYVLFGARIFGIDWFSIEFGALIGALLYGGYNAITPLTPLSLNEPPVWRALQGGIDGLWIGALLGLATLFVSGRPLHIDRGGLTRYGMLYVTVILLAWVILMAQSMVHFPDVVAVIVGIPLLGVLRLAVGWLDRQADNKRYRYDES